MPPSSPVSATLENEAGATGWFQRQSQRGPLERGSRLSSRRVPKGRGRRPMSQKTASGPLARLAEPGGASVVPVHADSRVAAGQPHRSLGDRPKVNQPQPRGTGPTFREWLGGPRRMACALVRQRRLTMLETVRQTPGAACQRLGAHANGTPGAGRTTGQLARRGLREFLDPAMSGGFQAIAGRP